MHAVRGRAGKWGRGHAGSGEGEGTAVSYRRPWLVITHDRARLRVAASRCENAAETLLAV